jgi:hypothetical protein
MFVVCRKYEFHAVQIVSDDFFAKKINKMRQGNPLRQTISVKAKLIAGKRIFCGNIALEMSYRDEKLPYAYFPARRQSRRAALW